MTNNPIRFFTDGACSNNQAGIDKLTICGAGLYISGIDKSMNKTIRKGSKQIFKFKDEVHLLTFDVCSNNVAELYAVLMALIEGVKMRMGTIDRPIVIVSDSKYVIGMFRDNNNATKNKELIQLIRRVIKIFELHIEWIHVYGHQKPKDKSTLNTEELDLIYGNNKADELAVEACKV